MCGRYIQFDLDVYAPLIGTPTPKIRKRFNIAPSQQVLTIRMDSGSVVTEDARWGFLPEWADSAKELKNGAPINARAETVATTPMFRASFKHQRCLLPANGFYEWAKVPDQPKQPYWIGLEKYAGFALAGVYSERDDGLTVAIVTRAAGPTVERLHNRMPVIVAPDRYEAWIDPDTDPVELQAILDDTAIADRFQSYAVSRAVNSPANDQPELLDPIDPTGPKSPEGGQLF